MELSEPRIEDYFCYRTYLSDFFKYKKSSNPNYSYRVFTQKAGLKSSGHLKMVIDRDRNIGDKTLPMYLKGLSFSKKKEKEIFKLLVQYDQTQDLSDKTKIFEKILSLKEKSGASTLQASQFKLLSEAHIVTIYVLVGLERFSGSIDAIQKALSEQVSRAKVEKALLLLLEMDLIEVRGGRYVQKQGALSTADDIQTIAVNRYHEEMVKLSLESLKKDHFKQRNFNGVTIGIDAEKYGLVCEKLNNFRKELNELLSDDSNANRVYQLNLNLFPLTKELE